MWMLVLILLAAFIIGGAAFVLPQAQGFSGCLLFIGAVLFIVFFMGSCVNVVMSPY